MITQNPLRDFRPSYLTLLASGELETRAGLAAVRLEDCDLCARTCHVNRRQAVEGAVCRTGERAVVNSFGPHHGEEDPLSGHGGSGTIFFSGCNLRCVFCQNWEISQKQVGREVEPDELADMMCRLQEQGCHNINFVSPSHVVAQILAAVPIAARRGLQLPLVYNTGGYDSIEALALLDGIIDIYMPDMKFGDSATARASTGARGYWEQNRVVIREMHRQVGDLVMDKRGVALRGLLVRHLVLPENLGKTEEVVRFLAGEVSSNTYLNLMDQYHPCYRASEHPPLDRPLRREEYAQAVKLAESLGLRRFERRGHPWRV